MNDVSRGRWAARVLVRVLWIVTAIVALLVGTELLFQLRAALRGTVPSSASPRVDALDRAYAPFSVQHLHPQYLFFFPLDPQARTAMGNGVCSIDAEGFREPGPAHAQGRKLAVLIGGSAAFGYYASSNATTITSYLNGLQDEYFFVNAGVPSWTSTQELFRLLFQIADLRPALVMTYDGANDAAMAGTTNPNGGAPYPPGTPANFDELENLADDLRAGPRFTWAARLFPELSRRLEKWRDEPSPPEPPVAKADIAASARVYLSNQARMALLTRNGGARFVSVFQPLTELHQHVEPWRRDPGGKVTAFHDAVVAAPPPAYEFHDLATVFDEYFASVPVAGVDLDDDTIFVDWVHLTDRGNAIIARHLLGLLGLR